METLNINKLPVILMGDFNLEPNSEAIAILKKNNTSFEPKSKSSSSENNVVSVKLDEVKREIQKDIYYPFK